MAARKPFFTFYRKLFISIVSLFLLFVLFISIFQYRREKNFRIDLLTEQMESYNDLLFEVIEKDGLKDSTIRNALGFLHVEGLRITVIDHIGNVLYDSEASHLANHLTRPEVKDAIALGQGVAVRRVSETTGKVFFYAASSYPNYIIRCSRPYDSSLNKVLKADLSFVLFIVTILIAFLIVLYGSTRRLGRSIAQLRDFAEAADKHEPLDTTQEFPDDELGEISGHIVGLFRDLSATKDDLLLEREKFISHFQNASEGLAVFGSDRREIVANNLFIDYLNLISNRTTEVASALFELPELDDLNKHLEKMQAIRVPATSHQRRLFTVEKNGRVFDIQCILFPDKSFEISINDVTQNEVESRLKRQLTQNIAHELKTPVSSIQGYMETILNNPELSAEKLKSFVERSYLQSKRLSDLLRDISTLTRMDEAPNLMEKEEVNVLKLVEQITTELESELQSRSIGVTIEIGPEVNVNGNPSLLYSIFRNLMDNALAYAGEGIKIGITCFRKDPDRYYFSFYDTGVGLPEEHLNRIFERFYRVDKGRTRKLGGTGLGLAIVKNAVQIHGGTIAAKNRDGGGLEVVFSLSN